MEEEFRDIPGYEGYYQVSNFGRVKSLERITYSLRYGKQLKYTTKEKLLELCIIASGYYVVTLHKNGKQLTKKVHKLMHITFTDKFNKGLPCIDHIDRDRTNNHIDNLRECTQQENNRNLTSAKNATSKYLGVHIDPTASKWMSKITANGIPTALGTFSDEVECAKIYDSAAKYYHKEFANLNFPEDTTILPMSISEIKHYNLNRRELTSNYRGVYYNKKAKKWTSEITIYKKTVNLGTFDDKITAALHYDSIFKYYFKDKNRLNLPNDNTLPPMSIETYRLKYLYKFRSKRKNATSKYNGVSWNKANNKWKAYTNINKKEKYIGYFIKEIEAAKAFDKFIIENSLSLDRLNFPIEDTNE